MEVKVTYKPFKETEWDRTKVYTDKMKGGRCYRDKSSGGVFRWFLPYPDDDTTVIYGVYPDGSAWSGKESGCYAGDHILECVGIPYEDAERIDIDVFMKELGKMLNAGQELVRLSASS